MGEQWNPPTRGPLTWDSGSLIVTKAVVANSFWRRFVGLMGRDRLNDEALIFPRTNAIHTFFMKVPIDVLFVDKRGQVVRSVCQVPPWKIGPTAKGATWTIELPAGTLHGDEDLRFLHSD